MVRRIEDRVTRWSECAFDIRATRKYAKDGPLSIDEQSRALLAVSRYQRRVSKMTTKGIAG